MRLTTQAPRTVLTAGALVCAQGLVGLVFVVLLLVQGFRGLSEMGGSVFGEAAYFAVLTAAVLAVGIGLVLGKQWARSPAVVVQILLAGVAWYAAGPSGRPEYGVPVGIVCVGVLVLLFRPASTSWAQGDPEDAAP